MGAEIRAADFPPPFSSDEVIAAPTDAPDDRIDVGVLIVGGGPAGLACAIRLGQLLEEDPATAERLGEVPVALVEKGKQPGSHLLSGAVMNPGPSVACSRDGPISLQASRPTGRCRARASTC